MSRTAIERVRRHAELGFIESDPLRRALFEVLAIAEESTALRRRAQKAVTALRQHDSCGCDEAVMAARAALAPLPARKPKKPEPPAKYEPDPFVEGILARDVAPLPARGKRRKST